MTTDSRRTRFIDTTPLELPEQRPDAERRAPTIKGTALVTANEARDLVTRADRALRVDLVVNLNSFADAFNANADTLDRTLHALDVTAAAAREALTALERRTWRDRVRRLLNRFRRVERPMPEVMTPLPRIVTRSRDEALRELAAMAGVPLDADTTLAVVRKPPVDPLAFDKPSPHPPVPRLVP